MIVMYVQWSYMIDSKQDPIVGNSHIAVPKSKGRPIRTQ